MKIKVVITLEASDLAPTSPADLLFEVKNFFETPLATEGLMEDLTGYLSEAGVLEGGIFYRGLEVVEE